MFQVAGSAIGLRNITDGSSNTIAFGEWRAGSGNYNTVTIPTDIIMIGSLPGNATRNTASMTAITPPVLTNWLQSCAAGAALASNRGNKKTVTLGECWAVALPTVTLGNVLTGPNPRFPNCNNSTGSAGAINTPGHYGMSSRHPGGANVLMCDGSVRFLKDSVNIATVWAIGSRAQGEVVSADSY